MAYPVNIEECGHFYHICFKTNNDRFALTVEKDIHSLASYMQHYKKIHKIKIHAFAIMSNHVHLLLKNSMLEVNAIKHFLRDVKREFAKYHNIRYGAKGSLWKRSYTQKCIQGNIQLINTMAYILNNPVEAHMVDFAWQYTWSSSHDLLRKDEFKKTIISDRFLDKKDLTNILHRAKTQKYAEGLPEKELCKRGLAHYVDKEKFKSELIQGKKRYKTQGPWQYYFPMQRKSTYATANGYFSSTLTDKLPEAIRPSARLLRNLCRTKAEGSRNKLNPFKTNRNNILYEASKRSQIQAFQQTQAHRLPLRALGDEAIIQTDHGWALVVLHGRQRVS